MPCHVLQSINKAIDVSVKDVLANIGHGPCAFGAGVEKANVLAGPFFIGNSSLFRNVRDVGW